MTSSERKPGVRLSELLGSLSYALDLTEGQPIGHSIRGCLIGMRLADHLALEPETRSALFYALLLKDAGCSSNAAEYTRLFGSDDRAVKRDLKTVNWSRQPDAALYALRNSAIGGSWVDKLRHFVKIARADGAAANLVRIRCHRGAEICQTLGFPDATAEAVRCLDEHWDGAGNPEGLEGEEIPPLARIALMAQTLDVFAIEAGRREALDVIRRRRGTWFDPELVDVVASWGENDPWWDRIYGGEANRLLREAEPADRTLLVDEERLDRVAEGFAEIIDAKSPYTARHSFGVASFARGIGRELGLDDDELRDIHRAGLLHDIGKLAISNTILDKDGPLTAAERETIQQHPVHTWTILSQVEPLAGIARMASVHHEKLDGSGYPWGFDAERLDRPSRILAVADIYEALTAERPYREPIDRDRALKIIHEEALDPEAVEGLEASLG